MFRVTQLSPAFDQDAHKAPGELHALVTRFTAQQSFPNENVDFCFAQLDHQATQPVASTFPVQPHACGRS